MIGLLGIATMLALAVLFSEDRSAIRVGPALRTFGLQVGLAVIALATPAGLAVLSAMSNGVQAILLHSRAGIEFVFAEAEEGTRPLLTSLKSLADKAHGKRGKPDEGNPGAESRGTLV